MAAYLIASFSGQFFGEIKEGTWWNDFSIDEIQTMEVVLMPRTSLKASELVSCYLQVNPKLKYKDICTLIYVHHGVPIPRRQIKEIRKKKKLLEEKQFTT